MANNHTFDLHYASGSTDAYYVISTNLSYVRPQIINKPLSTTTMIGTNGGFFRPQEKDKYDIPPKNGTSISWVKYGVDNYIYNGGYIDTDDDGIDDTLTTIKRGSLYIYEDDGGFLKQRGGVMRVETADEILDAYPNRDIKAIIGGGDLALDKSIGEWRDIRDEEEFGGIYTLDVVARTGLGIKYDSSTGITTAYLVVSGFVASLESLRNFFLNDLECDAAIHLDGSGSSCMQYRNEANELCSYSMNGSNPGRYIWNMVRITNES